MWERNYIFLCNPEKNTECKKADCQRSCFFTSHKEFSKDGKNYVHAVNGNIIEWKGEENEGYGKQFNPKGFTESD